MKSKILYAGVGIGVISLLAAYGFQDDVNLEVTVQGTSIPYVCITNHDERELLVSSVIINKRRSLECEFFGFKFENEETEFSDISTIGMADMRSEQFKISHTKNPTKILMGDRFCVNTQALCGNVVHVGMTTNFGELEYNIK